MTLGFPRNRLFFSAHVAPLAFSLSSISNYRMADDEIAFDNAERIFIEWVPHVIDADATAAIADMISQIRGSKATKIVNHYRGSFNIGIQIRFEDNGPDALIRYAKPGVVANRDEKVQYEVAVMQYLRQCTKIPIPKIIGWGLTKDCPKKLGPFIIMEFVNGVKLSDFLRDPNNTDEPLLNPNISQNDFDKVYGQIADILIQIHDLDFGAIGVIAADGTVVSRPWTYNENELMTCVTNFPADESALQPFTSSSQYIQHLAERHLVHLDTQRNIATDDDESEKRYKARHLFRSLVPRFFPPTESSDKGPFKLFCDDMRPANMLVNPTTLDILAVIDFEFTYTAPPAFSESPPWWLLLAGPEELLRRGYSVKEFETLYTPVLEKFVSLLKKKELFRDPKEKRQLLSDKMCASWKNGMFWFILAARKSWDVDMLFPVTLECYIPEKDASHAWPAMPAFVKLKRHQLEEYNVDRAK